MNSIQKILIPIDLDLDSHPILDLACTVATAFRSKVELIHVFETVGYGGPMSMEALDDSDPRFQQEMEQWRTYRAMLRLLRELHGKGIQARGRMAFGVVEETLTSLAREESFDLIVIGSHSREGLDRFVHGSVAGALIRSSPCPVLVLPHVQDAMPGI
ncbi:MAG TPA: universal stress protein [Geothrix sp.]|nr:universal stress protein [Geothrix sp.]